MEKQKDYKEPEYRQYESDEIDLRKVFAEIGNFFQRIWNGIIYSIISFKRSSVRYRYLIILLLVAGLLLGFFYRTVKAPVYQSSMIVRSEYLSDLLLENAIQKLNSMLSDTTRMEISTFLNLNQSTAKNIASFTYEAVRSEKDVAEFEFIAEQLEKLETTGAEINELINQIERNNQETFEITVLVNDPNELEGLEEAVVNYFAELDYIEKRLEINKRNLNARREKLLIESEKLDSLKEIIYANYVKMAVRDREGSNNVILNDAQVTNPLDVVNQDLSLYNQRLNTEERLYLRPEFEVISGFTTFLQPASDNLRDTLIKAFLISLAAAYGIIFLIEVNRYLNRVERERYQTQEETTA